MNKNMKLINFGFLTVFYFSGDGDRRYLEIRTKKKVYEFHFGLTVMDNHCK